MQADEELKVYDVLKQDQCVFLRAADLGLIWAKCLYRLVPILSVSYRINTSFETRAARNDGIVFAQAHPKRMTLQG